MRSRLETLSTTGAAFAKPLLKDDTGGLGVAIFFADPPAECARRARMTQAIVSGA